MLAAGAISILSKGERPEVVSPLGVVPKGTEGKFRLIINVSYVNEHLAKLKLKFEGLRDLAYMAKKGNHAVSLRSYLRVLSCGTVPSNSNLHVVRVEG